jgi:uncharacterized protein (DUF885 family)
LIAILTGGVMNEEFHQKADEILDYWWETNPISATFKGIHDHDDKLERLDPDSREETLGRYKRFISDLSRFESSPGLLDDNEMLDLRMLKAYLDSTVQLDINYRRSERDATVFPDICLWSVYILLMRDFAPLERRMESVLARLREVPRVLEEGKANLKASKDPPAAWTRMGMEVAQSGTAFFAGLLPMYASEVPELSKDVSAATGSAIMAMESYTDFLQNEIMPASDGEYRLGEEMFDYLLKYGHMLPYTTDDLAEIGRDCIDKTTAALEAAAAEIDGSRSWAELVADLKKNTPVANELLDSYRKEIQRARHFVVEKDLVSIPGDESLDVAEMPKFEVARSPYAGCIVPPPFEKQEGVFLVTPIDPNLPAEQQREQLSGHSKPSIILTSVHEAYPGHHLQFLHSNRVDSNVRKAFGSTLFAEGWALYCEDMMFEEGFYDLTARLFQLKDELWRACRVVIDVDLHRGRMDFQEAVRMLVSVAGLEEVNAIAEVKRYTQSPTQPMSYIVGKLAIMKLRDDYRNKAKDSFSLKSFHDRLLSYGTIPVGLVAEQMLK